MSAEEGACPGTFFQPAAAGDEVDVTVAIQCLLFVEDAVGKVTFASASVDEGAVVAFLLVVGALAGMVTDASAGPHVVHGPDDDLRGECFRKYKRVEDSYDDHSRFLAERSRYERLFKLNIKDYKGWAKGLQKCGYATDRAYANKLIKVIEDYELYRFDSGKRKKKTSTKKQNLPVFNYQVYRTHGLIYVYAKDNDSFDQIARSMGLKAKQLMKFNEVPEDFPLQAGDIVYLEKKKKKADKPNYDHVVQVGESMHSIAQMYGIQIKSLYKMNKKDKDYIPEEGDVLKLR